MPSEYKAGVCNIGTAEINYRKKVVGYGSALVGSALYIMLIFFNFPLWLYLVIVIPAFVSVHGFNESRKGFCTAYGRSGKYNMASEVGLTQDVLIGEKREQDKRYSNKLTLQSLRLALLISIILIAASRLFN